MNFKRKFLGLALLAPVLLSGCSKANLPTSSQGLSLQEAQKIVVQDWANYEQANQNLDAGLIETHESGVAQTIDSAIIKLYKLEKYKLVPTAKLNKIQVYLSQEINFPRQFLVLETLEGRDSSNAPTQYRQIAVYFQTAATTPWMVSWKSPLNASFTSANDFLTDAQGAYSQITPEPNSLILTPSELASEISLIWFKDAHANPEIFSNPLELTNFSSKLAQEQHDFIQTCKCTLDYSTKVANYPDYLFPLSNGDYIYLFGLDLSSLYKGSLQQISSGGDIVGPNKIGAYSQIETHTLELFVAHIPAKTTTNAKVQILGHLEQAISATGT